MAIQLVKEWTAIQQFPAATQGRLLELLGKLKQEVLVLPLKFSIFSLHYAIFFVTKKLGLTGNNFRN
jgi:hypothetical protein